MNPSHTDRARALRLVLALLKQDKDVVYLIGEEVARLEVQEIADFFLLLADHTAMLAKQRLRDPVGYFESWVALELQLAEDKGDPSPSQTGGVT